MNGKYLKLQISTESVKNQETIKKPIRKHKTIRSMRF